MVITVTPTGTGGLVVNTLAVVGAVTIALKVRKGIRTYNIIRLKKQPEYDHLVTDLSMRIERFLQPTS